MTEHTTRVSGCALPPKAIPNAANVRMYPFRAEVCIAALRDISPVIKQWMITGQEQKDHS